MANQLALGTVVLAVILSSSCAEFTVASKDSARAESYRQAAEEQIIKVKGCVHRPGSFSIRSRAGLTLWDALQLAGGTIAGDYFANERSAVLTHVRVLRLSRGSIIVFNVNVAPGAAGRNFIIHPGDLIYVPELV